MTLCAQGRDYVPQTFEPLDAARHHAETHAALVWTALVVFLAAAFLRDKLKWKYRQILLLPMFASLALIFYPAWQAWHFDPLNPIHYALAVALGIVAVFTLYVGGGLTIEALKKRRY